MPETIQQQLERLRSLVHNRLCHPCLVEADYKAMEAALAIIDKLETTADGVPVIPGMVVWFESAIGTIWHCKATQFVYDTLDEILTPWGWISLDKCYSTREAVEVAKGDDTNDLPTTRS